MESNLQKARRRLHEKSHAQLAFEAYNPQEFLSKFDMLDIIDQRRWLGVYNACIKHNSNCKYKLNYIVVEDVEEDA